jgi:hypothetical protein
MKIQLLLAATLITLAAAHELVNRVSLTGSIDPQAHCWFTIRNSEQLLDLRTNCPIGNQTERLGFNLLLQLVPSGKAYFFRVNGTEIRGYRYIKDPQNYFFKFYDF